MRRRRGLHREGAARGFTRGALATGLMSVLVIAAMVAIVVLSRQAADSHRRAQDLAEQIRASSQEMSALKWRANTNVLSGTADFSSSGALVSGGARILAQLNDEVTQLRQIQPGPDANRLLADVQRLISGSLQGLDAARAVNAQATDRLAQMQGTFQPILDRMDADAALAADHQQAVAGSAMERLQWTSIAAMLLGICVLGVLGWRLASVRRRAMLAEQERVAERRSEERIRELVEHSSDVVTLLDAELNIRWQGASVRALLGLEPGDLVNTAIVDLVHPHDRPLLENVLKTRLEGGPPATLRARLRHADGAWIHVEIVAANRFANPAINGLVLNVRDISERVAFEDELHTQAFRDSLTGLANRALFENRLRHALAAGQRTQRLLAVLFLDLDDFKTINDSLGHGAGDQLLQRVAERLEPIVRPSDTAARLGGDEFAVLLDGVDNVDQAHDVAERIRTALGKTIVLDAGQLDMTASIGIALTDGSVETDEVLRNADTAMYAAKAGGKNAVKAFEQQMHRSAVERLELRNQLPRALENDELFLEYQPIVSLHTGRVLGVEALVRWQHPTRGRLMPDQFIRMAEETGLVVALGRWVLERACADMQEMHLALDDVEPPPYVSVNVSIRQLHEEAFPGCVGEILSATGLRPQSLVLEITEGLLADDQEAIVRRLHAFKRLGIRIAVDDFGTGYSALSHLQHFPVDILKIDKSFIDELHTNEQTASLVQGVINLGETLELDVIAEGVENPQQADRLRAMRSPLAQGFLFSKPIAASKVIEFVREPRQLPPLTTH